MRDGSGVVFGGGMLWCWNGERWRWRMGFENLSRPALSTPRTKEGVLNLERGWRLPSL